MLNENRYEYFSNCVTVWGKCMRNSVAKGVWRLQFARFDRLISYRLPQRHWAIPSQKGRQTGLSLGRGTT